MRMSEHEYKMWLQRFERKPMREPDRQALAGTIKAWHLRPSPKYENANVNAYFVTGPFHPAWKWWMVTVVHLQDRPGLAPAVRAYPEAEYEFMIWSLEEEPDIDGLESAGPSKPLAMLMPADVVAQFDGVSRDQAAGIVDAAVDAIMNGLASPDSDYRSWWEEMIARTVAHLQEGLHP